MTRGQHGWRLVPALLVALVLPFVFLPSATATVGGVETPALVRVDDTRSVATTDHQRVAVLTLSIATIPIGTALDAAGPDGSPRANPSRLGVTRLPNTVAAIARTVLAPPGRSPPTTPE